MFGTNPNAPNAIGTTMHIIRRQPYGDTAANSPDKTTQ